MQSKVLVCQWDEDKIDKFFSVWCNDCLNGLSISLLILFHLYRYMSSAEMEVLKQKCKEVVKWCQICYYFMWEQGTSGSPVCSCWEERQWTTALCRWLIPRDIRIKESSEDWLEKGMLLCLQSAGTNVGLLMGMPSDKPGCCFSSAGVTHLCADVDLLFSRLKSQPDHKGKNFL